MLLPSEVVAAALCSVEAASDVSAIEDCSNIFVWRRWRQCLAEAAIMSETRGGITSYFSGNSSSFMFRGGWQRFFPVGGGSVVFVW